MSYLLRLLLIVANIYLSPASGMLTIMVGPALTTAVKSSHLHPMAQSYMRFWMHQAHGMTPTLPIACIQNCSIILPMDIELSAIPRFQGVLIDSNTESWPQWRKATDSRKVLVHIRDSKYWMSSSFRHDRLPNGGWGLSKGHLEDSSSLSPQLTIFIEHKSLS